MSAVLSNFSVVANVSISNNEHFSFHSFSGCHLTFTVLLSSVVFLETSPPSCTHTHTLSSLCGGVC